ncbi:MAG: Hpt domain-containing protein [Cyanothece sp. SIO1E1]|nr:Hpt domain-containing protein [Cyanothece sp. SIO1E1]
MENFQFDWNHLHELSDGDEEFELELLRMFVEDAQAHADSIKTALVAQDADSTEKAAHHIKGASANVGAIAIHQVVDQMEQQARQQQLQDMQAPLAQLEALLGQVQAYIDSQNSD